MDGTEANTAMLAAAAYREEITKEAIRRIKKQAAETEALYASVHHALKMHADLMVFSRLKYCDITLYFL